MRFRRSAGSGKKTSTCTRHGSGKPRLHWNGERIKTMWERIKLRQWAAAGVLIGALTFAQLCLAQGTGVIYGTVTDPSSAGIAGARVEAVLTERGTTRTGTM